MRYKILLLCILLFFSACGNEDVFTCKEYAQDNNLTYLDANLSPLNKTEIYVLQKNRAWIEPVVNLADIKFEISSIELSTKNQCVKIKQDENDTHDAQIIFQ